MVSAQTIRFNLDPTGEHDEQTLQDALERSGFINSRASEASRRHHDRRGTGLSHGSRSSTHGLDQEVSSGGHNFSLGTTSSPFDRLQPLRRIDGRSTAALVARPGPGKTQQGRHVRRSNVGLLHPPTRSPPGLPWLCSASVDTETDRNVQRVIREEFKDATILTIAHRLDTIIGQSFPASAPCLSWHCGCKL